MKLKTLFNKLSLPLLLVTSLCACSRFIEGAVFLDKNANNVKDYGEPAISGMPFTVTRNNAALQSAVTDADGHFFVTTGINDIDVNFCAQVRSEDVSAFHAAEPGAAKAPKALASDPEATPEVKAEDCSKKSDGKPDCSDSDCCGESECDDASECKEEEVDKNACPKKSGGDPDCDDSRCSAEAACNTRTVQSMQACDKSKASVLTMNLDVPVAMDYTSRVAKLDEVRSGPVAVGDKFGIEITYPSSCSFEPYALPKAFAPIGLGEAFNSSTHELLLGKAILNQPSQVMTQDSPPFTHDKLHTYVLRLEVVGTEGQKDGEIKIQPTVSCPDGKKTPASANVISFKSEAGAPTPSAFSLNAELTSNCPELGESATLKTLIEAQDSADYAEATYTVFLGGKENFSIESMPGQCQDKGATIECDMDTLHMGTKAEFLIKFKMEDSVSEPTSFSFTSQLEANGAQFTDTAIVCNYP